MIHERDQGVGKVEKVRKKGKYFTPQDYCAGSVYLEFVSDVNGR